MITAAAAWLSLLTGVFIVLTGVFTVLTGVFTVLPGAGSSLRSGGLSLITHTVDHLRTPCVTAVAVPSLTAAATCTTAAPSAPLRLPRPSLVLFPPTPLPRVSFYHCCCRCRLYALSTLSYDTPSHSVAVCQETGRHRLPPISSRLGCQADT